MKTINRILIALVFIMLTERASALTIIRDFIGEINKDRMAPTNSTGTGNITNIFNAACDVWELAIQDDHVLTLHCSWYTNGGGNQTLIAQGGNPNRETEGTINFSNDGNPGHYSWFLDSNPLQNGGNTNYTEVVTDLGGGPINSTRLFTIPSSGPQNDLFTAALHEIGHALGMSFGNTSFMAEKVDADIDITAPRPFPGMIIALQTNFTMITSHFSTTVSEKAIMTGSFSPGERAMPSELDIVALAQLSKFSQLNLKLVPRLKIAGPYVTTSVVMKKGKPVTTVLNTVLLSWIQPIGEYRVELSPDLKNWSSVTNVPAVTNGIYSVTVSTTNSTSFFRLKKLP